jgi:PAS domain S-box-containing protein
MIDFPKQLLLSSLNLVPAHTWYADPSGALTFVNQRCADYLGLPKDHPLRSGMASGGAWDAHIAFLHPDDHDASRQAWSTCIDSVSAGEFTFRIRNADGVYRWFLSRAEPYRGDDGELCCWVGINLDIEERKQAEFYLAEGQRLAHTGSWALNAEGFEFWSSELFRIHGLDTGGNAPSIPDYLALVHPDDRDYVTREIQKMLVMHSQFDFTKRIVRPDGAIRHVRCVGTPVFDGEIFRRFVGTGMDVTDHEQLIVALRKGEEELRQILDLAPQHIGILGPNREHIYLNRAALAYGGFSLEEWLRAPPGKVIYPDDRERMKAFHQRKSTVSTNEIELRLPKFDGSIRWFLAQFNAVCDDQGQVLRWYAACTDIDERKRAEERLRQENVALRAEIEKNSMFEEIVGTSPALTTVLSRVSKVAGTDSTVLIVGETGTGKELIARAIHRRSPRSPNAFVAVNCAAIPRELVVSELFGHEKGAFTGATHRRLGRFELADGGTIFLDEVSELLPDTQAALLRVLQEREFERIGGNEAIRADVRVIAATNRDLVRAVADGSFRRDLFYRLNVFPVEMPPLRERTGDIPQLVKYFVERYARKAGKVFQHINGRTLHHLQSYPWPGNVRELQNVIERSVIVCDSEEFKIDDSWLSAGSAVESQIALSSTLASHERAIIEEALRICGGRVFGPTGAAIRLGIPRSTLESKIRALKIDKSRFRRGLVEN